MRPARVLSEEQRDRWEVRVLDPNPGITLRALQSVRCWRSALGLCDAAAAPEVVLRVSSYPMWSLQGLLRLHEVGLSAEEDGACHRAGVRGAGYRSRDTSHSHWQLQILRQPFTCLLSVQCRSLPPPLSIFITQTATRQWVLFFDTFSMSSSTLQALSCANSVMLPPRGPSCLIFLAKNLVLPTFPMYLPSC